MKTLKNLIKESRIENFEIRTENYVQLQETAFKIADNIKSFGQCPHSIPGTPNKFIVRFPQEVEHQGHKFNSLTFVDNSNTIYFNEYFQTALECAELDGWIEE